MKYVLSGTAVSKDYFAVDYDIGAIMLTRALSATGSPNFQVCDLDSLRLMLSYFACSC